jgi:AAA domain
VKLDAGLAAEVRWALELQPGHADHNGDLIGTCPFCDDTITLVGDTFACAGPCDDLQAAATLVEHAETHNALRPSATPKPTVPPPDGPFSMPAADFAADAVDTPPALVGTDRDCLLPALGLALVVARGGYGKTTLIVDFALHAASGVDWLTLPIERPVRLLFIENEGPRELFRRKLARRLDGWPHQLADRLHIFTGNWAAARLDDKALVARLNAACDELGIELVIGDPLDSLGMQGEGSPSETRRMVDQLKAAGLGRTRAWLLPHHPRKANDVDAVDAASGAWGGRPDLMLKLERLGGNRARLSFPKARWASRQRDGYILSFDPAAEAFALVCEGAEERDLAAEVEVFLERKPLRTVKEIAAPSEASEPGIGAREEAVREVLEGGRFDSLTGDAARAAGRHPTAVLWKVRPVPGAPGAASAPPGGASAAPEGGRDPVGVPLPGAPAPHRSTRGDPGPGAPELDPVAEADRIAAAYKRPNPRSGV